MQTTVLFPGGFKPLHGGHIDLIYRYTELSEVSQVKLLIGPKERDGIDQNTAIELATTLLSNNDKVYIEASKYPSPVLTAFKEVEYATTPANYTLASSTKGKDYERAKDFINKHQPSEKYHSLLSDDIKVVSLPISVEPIYYKGRTDGFEGPISSTILRQDIMNNDYINFKTNYPGKSNIIIRNMWRKIVKLQTI